MSVGEACGGGQSFHAYKSSPRSELRKGEEDGTGKQCRPEGPYLVRFRLRNFLVVILGLQEAVGAEAQRIHGSLPKRVSTDGCSKA